MVQVQDITHDYKHILLFTQFRKMTINYKAGVYPEEAVDFIKMMLDVESTGEELGKKEAGLYSRIEKISSRFPRFKHHKNFYRTQAQFVNQLVIPVYSNEIFEDLLQFLSYYLTKEEFGSLRMTIDLILGRPYSSKRPAPMPPHEVVELLSSKRARTGASVQSLQRQVMEMRKDVRALKSILKGN
jgi:hypothetical protein